MFDSKLIKISKKIFSAAFTILVVFLIVYGAFNYQALKTRFLYWWTGRYGDEQQISSADWEPLSARDIIPGDTSEDNKLQDIPDQIIAPKIKVKAPIIFSDTYEEALNQKYLKKGVIIEKDSKGCGKKGNTLVSGHSSSRNIFRKGKYDTVFTLLDKLENGDYIVIYKDQRKFTYIVRYKKTVSRHDLKTVWQADFDYTLTLITCWPVGTDLKRLIVKAEYVEPETGSSVDY